MCLHNTQVIPIHESTPRHAKKNKIKIIKQLRHVWISRTQPKKKKKKTTERGEHEEERFRAVSSQALAWSANIFLGWAGGEGRDKREAEDRGRRECDGDVKLALAFHVMGCSRAETCQNMSSRVLCIMYHFLP